MNRTVRERRGLEMGEGQQCHFTPSPRRSFHHIARKGPQQAVHARLESLLRKGTLEVGGCLDVAGDLWSTRGRRRRARCRCPPPPRVGKHTVPALGLVPFHGYRKSRVVSRITSPAVLPPDVVPRAHHVSLLDSGCKRRNINACARRMSPNAPSSHAHAARGRQSRYGTYLAVLASITCNCDCNCNCNCTCTCTCTCRLVTCSCLLLPSTPICRPWHPGWV